MNCNTQKIVRPKAITYNKDPKVSRPFSAAHGKLKELEQQVVRNVVCELCRISAAQFFMKKNGSRGITLYEEKVIEITYKCFNLDAFAGEPLKKKSC